MQINILIVDDLEANLISLEALLQEVGEDYNIIKASSGIEALEITLSQQVDLIILDIQMPEMDGFEVAQLLKANKKTASIPVIFLTAAFKSDEWVHKGFELGAVDYLTKPIDENQFLNRISLYTRLITSIEENRKKDKVLHEQSKMASMGEMIGNIAHQWRQPLSIIRTAASGIQVQKEFDSLSDDFLNEMLEKINDSTEYLSQTIDDFRDFVKGDAKPVIFKVSKSLNKAFIIEESVLRNNDITLITDNLDETIEIENFSNLFLQIIINILNNAKDALKNIDGEKLIFVKLKEDNSKVQIDIQDNAGGISSEVMPMIFDPYFTTKHKSQGTGLGLYMSYNMMQNMHGDIKVSNKTFQYNGKSYKGALFSLVFNKKSKIS
ncbi:MAG: hybrid sensor histidine kinase/response regulator [Campylobacterota bacterium]|nr:hybrid sensor histidine kinase/response regulator [Campylobacterota bacterium]